MILKIQNKLEKNFQKGYSFLQKFKRNFIQNFELIFLLKGKNFKDISERIEKKIYLDLENSRKIFFLTKEKDFQKLNNSFKKERKKYMNFLFLLEKKNKPLLDKNLKFSFLEISKDDFSKEKYFRNLFSFKINEFGIVKGNFGKETQTYSLLFENFKRVLDEFEDYVFQKIYFKKTMSPSFRIF